MLFLGSCWYQSNDDTLHLLNNIRTIDACHGNYDNILILTELVVWVATFAIGGSQVAMHWPVSKTYWW